MSDSSKGGGGAGGMGMNMVTTVMAFSVSAFFVLFVFTRLLCARLHLSRAAAAGDAFVVRGYNVERGIHGLEPSVVTTFPTVKLGDGDGGQRPPVQESQCTVCLEEYEAKDVARVLPACGHAFHAACIDAWLRQHPTCPVCRASLRAKTAATRAATPLDYSLLAAAAAANAARAPQQQVPAASSSDLHLGASSPPQAVGTHQHRTDDDMGGDGLLEIISEEPSSSGDQTPAAAAAVAAGSGGDHSPRADDDAARQRKGSAGASGHC